MSNTKHLILIGPTRAASTALFDYLAAHPRVVRSTVKEARFFLRDDPHLPRIARHEDGVAGYATFFPDAGDRVWLEATPDYLYDPEAAERIDAALPGARVVFVRRDPVARLISWHRYAKQRGLLPGDTTADGYVQTMRAIEAAGGWARDTPQALRALGQGRYDAYLQAWRAAFGARLIELDFDEVRKGPARVIERLCEAAGLDVDFYEGYAFETVNASFTPARPGVTRMVRRVARALKPYVHDRPWARRPLRVMRRAIERRAGPRGNGSAPRGADVMSAETAAFLEQYYEAEPGGR